MGRALYIGAILLGAAMPFLAGGAASAQDFNHTITVYASVPEQRGIYVDSYGSIVKIAGNTSRNVTPQVFTAANQLLPMNESIQSQYDQFLKQHDYRLTPGKTYLINPLSVSIAADSRTISVDTGQLILGVDQSD